MTDLIDTTEMYLRTILELEEEGITPLRARIVERLEHSGPTVSQTVARMERDGLVKVGADRQLELTDDGRQLAVSVLRKHRLAERLLADVIGLDLAYVHDEACRWEHVMSDKVEARLRELLEDTAHTPYGTPIPAHPGEGSDAAWKDTLSLQGQTLHEFGRSGGVCCVLSLAEAIQADPELLGDLFDAQIRPGVRLEVKSTSDPDFLRVQALDHDDAPALELSADVSAHLRVEPSS